MYNLFNLFFNHSYKFGEELRKSCLNIFAILDFETNDFNANERIFSDLCTILQKYLNLHALYNFFLGAKM